MPNACYTTLCYTWLVRARIDSYPENFPAIDLSNRMQASRNPRPPKFTNLVGARANKLEGGVTAGDLTMFLVLGKSRCEQG